MGKLVYTNCQVNLAGTDISRWVKSVSLNNDIEPVESTGFGQNTKSFLSGLRDSKISLALNHDFDPAAIDSLLWGIFDARVPENLTVKPTTATVGPGNPAFTTTVFLQSYAPLSAQIGDIAETSVEFVQAANILAL